MRNLVGVLKSFRGSPVGRAQAEHQRAAGLLIGTPPSVVSCGPAGSRPWWGSPSAATPRRNGPTSLRSSRSCACRSGRSASIRTLELSSLTTVSWPAANRNVAWCTHIPSTSGVDPSGILGIGQFGEDVILGMLPASSDVGGELVLQPLQRIHRHSLALQGSDRPADRGQLDPELLAVLRGNAEQIGDDQGVANGLAYSLRNPQRPFAMNSSSWRSASSHMKSRSPSAAPVASRRLSRNGLGVTRRIHHHHQVGDGKLVTVPRSGRRYRHPPAARRAAAGTGRRWRSPPRRTRDPAEGCHRLVVPGHRIHLILRFLEDRVLLAKVIQVCVRLPIS